MTPNPGDRLDCTAAATYLGKSKSWLDTQRSLGRGPRFIRLGGRVFYRQRDLDSYIDAGVVETEDSRKAAAKGKAA